jgi:hypothetical protein
VSVLEYLLHLAERWKPIADWLTAVGTVSAVIVSLWLASRANKQRLRISAELVLEFNAGSAEPELWVTCSAQNRGAPEVMITDYGFQLWPWRSAPLLLTQPPDVRGSFAPIVLPYGGTTRVVQPLESFVGMLRGEGLISSHWKIFRLRMYVRTSLGKVTRKRVGARLRRELAALSPVAPLVDDNLA